MLHVEFIFWKYLPKHDIFTLISLNRSSLKNPLQQRIQDFSEEATTQKGGSLLFGQNLPKTAWKWRKLDGASKILLCRSATALNSDESE